MSSASSVDSRRAGLFSGANRGTSIGLVLIISLAAFEAIAVATAMPTAVRSLDGLAFYSWPFTAHLIANVVGMVLGGESSDRRGPVRPLLTGIGVFTIGLVVAGVAPWMWAFVLGRAVQGLGGGLVIVAVYVVIAETYDENLRPRMLGALAAAWVLPSLIGPVVSGALSEHASWRLVFLLIPPFVGFGLVLILPALRRLPHREMATGPFVRRWPFALLAAAAVVVLQYAGQRLNWWSLVLAIAGLALLIPAVRVLLPAGTVLVRRGLPAVVALRGLAAGAFMAVDAFLPLTLSELHGYSPTAAGIPLMVGAVGWAVASWWQGRRSDRRRHAVIRIGFAFVAIAAIVMASLALPAVPGWVSYPAWIFGGFGMGLIIPSLAILIFELSTPEERGQNSAAIQVSDVLGSALCVGAGGVLVAAAERGAVSLGAAVGTIDLAMAVIAVLGVVLAVQARDRGTPRV